ncbi:hypothetical protein LSAT2_018456, partial [Lamellibrachia satsuma]
RTDVWKLLADDDNDDITKDDDSTEGNEDNDGDEDNDDNTDDDEDNDSDEDNDDNTDDDEMNDCNENNDDNTDDDDNCDDDDSNIDNNDNSVKQNNIVITFLCGLLGDPRNAYYLKHLGSTDVLLDFYKEFIEKLKGKLENDTFKMVPYIYETQCKDLVDNVPEEIKASKIYPMEMLALCWVLAQDTCRVTSLDLSFCQLDIPLIKQLCEALQHNKSIQTLNLAVNDVFKKKEVGRMLGAALAYMEQLCELDVPECRLSKKSLQYVVEGLSQGCPRLTSLT